jgi:hypothetical protein
MESMHEVSFTHFPMVNSEGQDDTRVIPVHAKSPIVEVFLSSCVKSRPAELHIPPVDVRR